MSGNLYFWTYNSLSGTYHVKFVDIFFKRNSPFDGYFGFTCVKYLFLLAQAQAHFVS